MWGVLLWAAVALGQPASDLAEEADLHFRQAIEAYRGGKFEVALEHLLVSNRLVPNRNVQYNIARTYERLGDLQAAYGHYSRYLASETDPERIETVRAALDSLAGKLALVAVTTDPPGATIYVDRVDLGARGTTPIDLALDPGPHTIIVERDGHRTAEKAVEAEVGKRLQAEISLSAIVGTVRIVGSPAGAEVRLGGPEGDLLGQIPLEVELPPGPQVLVLAADGYRSTEQLVRVTEAEVSVVEATLPLLSGTLVVDGYEKGALIEVDGRAQGFTPAVVEVSAGERTVRVSKDGFAQFEQVVVIGVDEETRVDVELFPVDELTAASRKRQSVSEAPASVSLISAEEIRAFGYVDIYDALAGTRGFYQSNDLTYKALGVRGFAQSGDYGNRALVTLDGHAMNDDLLGASYVSDDLIADLHDVDQIEVVRGPGSALYGSNAFLGVVNVVTNKGEGHSHAYVTGNEGGTLRGRASLASGDSDQGASLSVASVQRQGLDYRFETYEDLPRGNDGDSVGADGSRSAMVHGKAWKGDWEVQGLYNQRTKDIPTGAFETLLGDSRALSLDGRGFAEARYRPRLSDAAALEVRAWADHYHFRGVYPYAAREVVEDTWSGTWLGVEPRVAWQVTPALGVTAGAEARSHVSARLGSRSIVAEETEVLLDEPAPYQVYSGYGIVQLDPAPALTLSLGGRVDYYSLPRTVPQDLSSTNPRLTAVLRPTANDVVKVMGGTAFRAPSIYEFRYNDGGITQIPAAALSPETIATTDLEWTHQLGEDWAIVAGGYASQIRNLVELRTLSDGLIQYGNSVVPVSSLGTEWEIRRRWRQGWMMALQQSLQRARTGGGDPLANSPSSLSSLKVAAPLVPGLVTLSSRLRVESPRRTERGARTGWASLWDATVTGRLPTLPVEYGVGVRNALDVKELHPGGPDLRQPRLIQPGRTLFLTLGVER